MAIQSFADAATETFFSIRINEQWRIVFRWTAQGPEDVAIIDYHRG